MAEFTDEQAEGLLLKCLGHQPKRVAHSIAVADYAAQVAKQLNAKKGKVNIDEVRRVGLCHDLGHGILSMPGGSIEEHALAELALFQSLGLSDVGYGAARDFATHEGLVYASHQMVMVDALPVVLPVNPALVEYLRQQGLPLLLTDSKIMYGELLASISFPTNNRKNLGHNLGEAIATSLLVPHTLEEAVVTYADLHLQQGEKGYDSQDKALRVVLPNGEEWSVAHGTFQDRVAEIKKRFGKSDNPNNVKILECVVASEQRLRALVAGINLNFLNVEPTGYLPPEKKDYTLR